MSKHWIAGAIKHPGTLKKKASAAGMSTRMYAQKHEHDGGKTGDQSRLALTLMGMHHKAAAKMYDRSKAK